VPELRVESAGASLAVTYTSAGPTALVALHGAAEGTRDFTLYRHLHDVLPSAGIGVATFDRRGEGQSSGEPSRGRFDAQADDALAVVRALGVPRVGLWGFSQGSWVAPFAAVRSDEVAFLVLLAATGVTPAEQMRYAVREQLERAGYGDDVIARALALRVQFGEWLRSGRNVVPLKAALQVSSDEEWWKLAFLPTPNTLNESIRRRICDEMFFDPKPVIARVRVPTLLIYGDDDSWTPVQASVDVWRRARQDAVDVVVVRGTGHEPKLASGTISPFYEQTLLDWLGRLDRRWPDT
jgi:uncharacterized protein